MITTGIAIFLSLLLIALKLPTRLLLRGLNYHLAIDISVTLLVLMVHFGTFSGIMAATFAGLMTSVTTSPAARLHSERQVRPRLLHAECVRWVMLTLISTLLQLAALFIYWPLASLLRALGFWRKVSMCPGDLGIAHPVPKPAGSSPSPLDL